DVLLVGPQGQSVILMSDVGGGSPVAGLTLTFADGSPALGSGPLTSGTYAPSNLGSGDSFPSPAPAGTPGAALSIFDGTDPNGDWSLYIVDDVAVDGGSVSD